MGLRQIQAFVHVSRTSTQIIHVPWTAAEFLWVGQPLDMQVATQFFEELDATVFVLHISARLEV